MGKRDKSLEILAYGLPCRTLSVSLYIILKECVISFFLFYVRLRYLLVLLKISCIRVHNNFFIFK